MWSSTGRAWQQCCQLPRFPVQFLWGPLLTLNKSIRQMAFIGAAQKTRDIRENAQTGCEYTILCCPHRGSIGDLIDLGHLLGSPSNLILNRYFLDTLFIIRSLLVNVVFYPGLLNVASICHDPVFTGHGLPCVSPWPFRTTRVNHSAFQLD